MPTHENICFEQYIELLEAQNISAVHRQSQLDGDEQATVVLTKGGSLIEMSTPVVATVVISLM